MSNRPNRLKDPGAYVVWWIREYTNTPWTTEPRLVTELRKHCSLPVLAAVLEVIGDTCAHCWDDTQGCQCWNDE